jgi:IS30 family transposase
MVLPNNISTGGTIIMDHSDYTTESRKGKHLNYGERSKIEVWHAEGHTAYWIARQLGRTQNTVLNAIRTGMTEQMRQGKIVRVYFADRSQAVYEEHRKHCGKPFRVLDSWDFIQAVCEAMENKNCIGRWSIDAAVGWVKRNRKFASSETVCTKTLYHYTDLGLMPFTNLDLPLKMKRNNKQKRVRENKKKLGNSIDQRPETVANREDFGDWEIDTVRGSRSGKGAALLTLAERKTRNSLICKLPDGTADSVFQALENLLVEYGDRFSRVFKTITGDNGSEFSHLSELEHSTATKVYFTHPYSSFEKGTNERHNGLIRCFIPKGHSIDNYSEEQIAWIEDWCNTLPRKILGYATPEELFEAQLDELYVAA